MGDRGIVGKVLRCFVADFGSRLDGLRERIAAGDGPGARSLAHTLKGAAATVAAESLQALAAAMEDAGAAGEVERCLQLLPRTAQEFERFRDAIKKAGWVTDEEKHG
jgi:HPt (histidine-containing phosphotransfer) domain-containing protein